jgi:hypothetical protein
MKILFTMLAISVSINAYSQLVEIQGYALDTLKNHNFVSITINDTLNKYIEYRKTDDEAISYHKIQKEFSTTTKKDGSFYIKARPTDSLFFSSNPLGLPKYITQSYAVEDLLSRDSIHIQLIPEKCIEYVECADENPELYVFVGEVIEVKEIEEAYYCNRIPFDSKYKAKLKILDNVYGSFSKDTIVFNAYDHYGKPNFANFKNVLIYVAKHCDTLYHQKYQFSPAYQIEGKWASTFNNSRKKNNDLYRQKAKPMKFDESVFFVVNNQVSDSLINVRLKKPYFSRKDSVFKPLYGNYVEDIFEIMKQTYFKESSYFKNQK